MSWIRKHTGTADQEADTIMEQLIEAADSYFDKIIAEKNMMKAMPLSVEDYGCVMGALYFEHELITPTQASAVIQERKKPTHKYSDQDTLWGLYKLLMFGIEGMDITKWVKSQQKLHHMIMTEYAIKVERPIGTTIGGIPQEVDERITWAEQELSKEPKGEDVGPPEMYQGYAELIMFENKEAFVDQAVKQFGKDKPLVEYYADNHFDETKSAIENINGFAEYIKTSEKPIQEIVIAEDLKKDSEEAVQSLAQIAEEVENTVDDSPQIDGIPNENTMSDTDDEDPFAEEVEEVSAEDLAVKHGIDIPAKSLSEEQIEIIKEETGKQDVSNLFEEDAKIKITGTTKNILDSLDEPVEILTPEESKEKGSDDFVFPTDLENTEKLQQSLEVPNEVKEQAEAIETRMKELYGSIRPYQVDGNLVTIDETHECFSI
jgi:hypothetical protein